MTIGFFGGAYLFWNLNGDRVDNASWIFFVIFVGFCNTINLIFFSNTKLEFQKKCFVQFGILKLSAFKGTIYKKNSCHIRNDHFDLKI